jgi:hypothetical protein
MLFYNLTHPPYTTDFERDAANPIEVCTSIKLPGIVCSECGNTWATHRRLYLEVHDTNLRQRLGGKPLPRTEWEALAREVKSDIGLPDDFSLLPGDRLGTPVAELLAEDIPDFSHLFPGQIIVQAQVLGALEGLTATGFRPVHLDVHYGDQVNISSKDAPELYELVVTGSAWQLGSDLDLITDCKYCGRIVFPYSGQLTVDTDRWDGSDFFHLDRNPNIVFVTERICSMLAQFEFRNYSCIPIDSVRL